MVVYLMWWICRNPDYILH